MDASGDLNRRIESYTDEMVKTLSEMIGIPAISPKSGGAGESKRADFLAKRLEGWGLEVKRYEYADETGTKRPSLVSRYGKGKRPIWIVAHMDTVAVGDRGLWSTDPFKAVVKDGRIYGRGTSDNGQSLVGSMYALRALMDINAELKYDFGLVLAADEEIGSVYGMQKLMDEGIFDKDDMFLVPDFGSAEGKLIEVGEKSILWLKVTVTGKQVHASTPEMGENAFRYAVKFLGTVDERLHGKYNASDPLFGPPTSTFEMTKHEANVSSVNIAPGVDVSYIDCRILPRYNSDDVLNDMRSIASGKEFSNVKIDVEEFVRVDSAPSTSPDAEIVRLLDEKILKLRGIKTVKKGVGGGTCAAFPRARGMQAAVWSTEEDVAHQPNEYARINDLVEDSKVFANLFI